MSFQDPNLFATIAGAGDLTDYAPRIEDGEHVLALNNYEIRQTRDYGTMVSVDYVVIESTSHKPGTVVGDAWFVGKAGTDGEYARKRALAFGKAAVQGLGGDPDDASIVMQQNGQPMLMPNGQPLTKGLALVQQTLSEMSAQAQPWRGLIIRASAGKRMSKKTGKAHTNVTYKPVTQTVDQIHACRARIEASAKAPPQAAPAQPAPQTYQGQGQAMGQFQAAPQPVAPQPTPAPATAPAAPQGQGFGFGMGGSLLNR